MAGNLNPRQFEPQYGEGLFHGTHHELRGDTILPSSKSGHGINWSGMSNPSVAYATENEDTAWSLAQSTHENNRAYSPEKAGRTRVHSLEPNDTMRVGLYHPDHPGHADHTDENLAEWISPHGFKVKETHDIRPDHQGTLNLNWTQFSKNPNHGYGDPFNHPSDSDIEYGHRGAFADDKPYKFRWGQEMIAEEKSKAIEEQIQDPKQGALIYPSEIDAMQRRN